MIRIGIVGYGNLGRGVEIALKDQEDMVLVGVFTRRNPEALTTVYPDTHKDTLNNIMKYQDQIDVLILCGGSKDDLPIQAPLLAEYFNIVDSFDTHNVINEYFEKLDGLLKSNQKVGVIAAGWDPGLFSLNRLLFTSVLPLGKCYTFWGKGVSQGHSDAIRRVPGVKRGVQYTVPIEETISEIRQGGTHDYDTAQKHRRVCYVVSTDDSLNESIATSIKTMPDYFADYYTEVFFIDEETFEKNHLAIPHGGLVIHNATTGVNKNHHQHLEFNLKLDSNPEFTSSVLVAYARATYRLANLNQYGCKTVFDIPLSYLSPKTDKQLRKELL